MQQVQGVIDNIWSKQKMSRAGKPFTLWYANIDGTEVNLGFRTNHKEGEYVTLDVEEKYNELQVVQGKKSNGGAPAPAAPRSKPAPRHHDFPVPLDDKGMSICRQSSLNRAVETMTHLPKTSIPKDTNDLVEAIIEIAYVYTDFVTGQREAKQAAAMEAYDDKEAE